MSVEVAVNQPTPLEVYEKVRNVLEQYLDLADSRHYDVMASWIIATCRVDEFNTVPYLCFMGPKASGKTTALQILNKLTCDPLYMEDPTQAALFRNAKGKTIIMDEVQDFLTSQRTPLYGLLNTGYTRGGKVIRMIGSAKEGFDNEEFDPFGFKALAILYPLKDTLMSRCIVIRTVRSSRMPLELDLDEFLNIVNNFLTPYVKALPPLSDTPKEIEQIRDPRLRQLFIPLLRVCPSENDRNILMEVAHILDQERLEEEMQDDNVMLLYAFRDVVKQRNAKDGDRILVAEVTDRYNSVYNEGEEWKVQQVGKRLSGWGFKKCKNHEGNKRAVYYNEALLNMLMETYSPREMSEVSKVSDEPESICDTSCQDN